MSATDKEHFAALDEIEALRSANAELRAKLTKMAEDWKTNHDMWRGLKQEAVARAERAECELAAVNEEKQAIWTSLSGIHLMPFGEYAQWREIVLRDHPEVKAERDRLREALQEIRHNAKLWRAPRIGGQDKYAGLPPAMRVIDAALAGTTGGDP